MTLVRGTPEVQPVQPQWHIHVTSDHVGERQTRHPPHDFADQPPVGQCVIAALGSRFVGRRFCRDRGDHVFPVEHVVRAVDDAAEPVKPCGVAQHVADGDVLLAVLRELRPVGGHSLVVVHQPRLGLEMQCCGRHPLGRAEAHRQRVGFPRIAFWRPQATPQVDHRFAAVEDGHGRAAVGAFELAGKGLLDRSEVAVREALHVSSLGFSGCSG